MLDKVDKSVESLVDGLESLVNGLANILTECVGAVDAGFGGGLLRCGDWWIVRGVGATLLPVLGLFPSAAAELTEKT